MMQVVVAREEVKVRSRCLGPRYESVSAEVFGDVLRNLLRLQPEDGGELKGYEAGQIGIAGLDGKCQVVAWILALFQRFS
jgi:hypothetical protein